MKLIELLNKYDFSDILNEIITMFPDFEEKKDLFQQAYDVLMQLKPVESKKKIHYTLMTDPDTDEDFFGADDSCFNTTWEVCLCKEIVLDEGVELSEIEITANCLINIVFIGRCPKSFEDIKAKLM
jgi:hypothetical protein